MMDFHVTPEYVNEHWTPESIHVLFDGRRRVMKRVPSQPGESEQSNQITDKEMFALIGMSEGSA